MNIRNWDKLGDWIIFAVMLLFAAVLLVSRNEPVVLGLRSLALQTSAGIDSRISWISSYASALNENANLREDNILLSSQVARSREALLENNRLRSLIRYSDSTAISLRPARIISKDITGRQNLMTLDIGSEDSVQIGMAVIDEHGVIGKVVLVSTSYSRVMPYINTDLRIPAKVLPMQAAGIVRWDGQRKDNLILDHVIKTEPVVTGQLVVASGFSSVYPEGIPVGTITEVHRIDGRNELVIHLKPAANATTASHVFVVMNRPDPERIELERTPVN